MSMSYQVTGTRRISLNGNLSPGGGGRTPLSVVAAFRYSWWPWAAVCSGSLPLSQCAECGGRIPLSVVAMGHCLWWPWAAVCGGRGPLSLVAAFRCLWWPHSAVRGGRGPLYVVAMGSTRGAAGPDGRSPRIKSWGSAARARGAAAGHCRAAGARASPGWATGRTRIGGLRRRPRRRRRAGRLPAPAPDLSLLLSGTRLPTDSEILIVVIDPDTQNLKDPGSPQSTS
jgi:hypothetical protein